MAKVTRDGHPDNQLLVVVHMSTLQFMEEILHQLSLVVYPIVYRVLYIPGGCLGFQPINSMLQEKTAKTKVFSESSEEVGF